MKKRLTPGRLTITALALILLLCPITANAASESITLGQAVEATVSAGITYEYTIEVEQETRAVLNLDLYDVPAEGSGISYVFSNSTEYAIASISASEDGSYSRTFTLPAGSTSFSITGYDPALTYIFSFDEGTCKILGHELTLIDSIDATCTSTGYTGDQVCQYCDYTEHGTELPLADHDLTLINDSAATCTSSGYSGDTVCTGCDYLVSGEILPMADHEWSTWITIIHPTYTKEGRSQRSCELCSLTEEQSIPVSIPVNPFIDVAADAYYYDAVLWAARNQITSGRTDTTFVPNDPCKRSEVVTFLWRTFTKQEDSNGLNPFTDVSKDAFYYNSVLWAAKNNITEGTSQTTFSPEVPCTRAQVVTFLWRASGSPAGSEETKFTDVASGQWYSTAVAWALNSGITQGTNQENTLFSPNATCTRSEIVTFLYRWIATDEIA